MKNFIITIHFCFLLVILLSACKTINSDFSELPQSIKIRIEGDEKPIKIKIEREFVMSDLDIAIKSLKLVSQIDTNQVYPYFPIELYWGDLPGLYGITLKRTTLTSSNGIIIFEINKAIVFNRKLVKPSKNNPNLMQYIFYGSVISHELHHYFYESEDPETHELTDNIIYKKIRENPALLKNLKF